MLYMGSTPLGGQLKSKLFTASGTLVVPADVSVLWVDASGGGCGGAGGHPAPGGGGGGGGGGLSGTGVMMPVVPGETLTITVGAAGLGGAAGANGGVGGYTGIAGSLMTLRFASSPNVATAGANPNGGNAGRCANGAPAVGGSGAGANATAQTTSLTNWGPIYACQNVLYNGSAGGALTFNGGYGFAANGICADNESYVLVAASGGASGGGGGCGGNNRYGRAGSGGSNGAAGSNATGYGAGGGGGSGNSAGGNGSPGFIRLYIITGYSI